MGLGRYKVPLPHLKKKAFLQEDRRFLNFSEKHTLNYEQEEAQGQMFTSQPKRDAEEDSLESSQIIDRLDDIATIIM